MNHATPLAAAHGSVPAADERANAAEFADRASTSAPGPPVRPEGHPCDPSLWISWEIPAQVSFAGILEPGCTCISVVSEGAFIGFGNLEFASHAVTPVVQPLWLMLPGLPTRERDVHFAASQLARVPTGIAGG